MASRKKRICSQPLRVMSELLRFQHREHEVTERENADEQSDSGVDAHVSPHFMSRSHKATYPMLTAKKRMEITTKTTSCTRHPLVREADPDRSDSPMPGAAIESLGRVAEGLELHTAVQVPRTEIGRATEWHRDEVRDAEVAERVVDKHRRVSCTCIQLVIVREAQTDLHRYADGSS